MNIGSGIPTVDLFAGAGLLSYSFKLYGCDSRMAVESDRRALASFQANVGAEATGFDVRRIAKDLECRILIAGPPCQGFSTLGKRDDDDERNTLSLLVSGWTLANKPDVVVIENVPRFLDSKYWKKIRTKLRRAGYDSEQWVLNAADFGAPQIRTRAFAILSRIGLPKQPVGQFLDRHRTVREAFDGLPAKPSGSGLDMAPQPGQLARERFRLIPPKGDKRDIMKRAPHLCPPSWWKLGAQATDVWGRMAFDSPANTIRCCFQNASKGRYIHPTEDRVITLREGARLQGIPDGWKMSGDRTSIARQIGNGVPIPLGSAVAKAVTALF